MANKIEKARQIFANSANCSQSTLVVFADELGISEKQAISVAAGFGAGMCYQGSTCGAVTGAYMAIGLLSGKKYSDTIMVKEHSYKLIREFNCKFEAKHRTTVCRELLGVDLSTADGLIEGKKQALFTKRCPIFVEDAVSIVESIIDEDKNI